MSLAKVTIIYLDGETRELTMAYDNYIKVARKAETSESGFVLLEDNRGKLRIILNLEAVAAIEAVTE